MTAFQIHALGDAVLRAARESGRDVAGNPVVPMTAEGGEPLRCCLRDARAGEDIILFGHEPVLPASPYREVGAVFAHARPCGGPAHEGDYPPDWVGRRQILRAYDRRGWIHSASRQHDGTEPLAAIAAVLSDPAVVLVHSRNVIYGCFMFAVTRASGSGATATRVA